MLNKCYKVQVLPEVTLISFEQILHMCSFKYIFSLFQVWSCSVPRCKIYFPAWRERGNWIFGVQEQLSTLLRSPVNCFFVSIFIMHEAARKLARAYFPKWHVIPKITKRGKTSKGHNTQAVSLSITSHDTLDALYRQKIDVSLQRRGVELLTRQSRFDVENKTVA